MAAAADLLDVLDVLIIGAGPTGLGLGRACAQAGLQVAVVDPRLAEPWPANYGVFVDEFARLGLPDVYRMEWPRMTALIDRRGELVIDRPYATLDNDRLKAHLCAEILDSGRGRLLRGRVSAVEHSATGSQVTLAEGSEVAALSARIVIDSSGHGARFSHAERRPADTIQVAFGLEIEVESHAYPLDRMVFLDFRDDAFSEHAELGGVASFLYVFPFARDRLFVEETNIGARPPVKVPLLKEKLRVRMQSLGLVPSRIVAEEVSVIPLDIELPRSRERTIAFGAASGLVNPISGYMVTTALTVAPRVADYLAGALRQPASDLARVAAGARKIVWPLSQRMTRRLRLAGLSVLRTLDHRDSQDFFRAFFELPAGRWERFLAPSCSPADAAITMALHYLRLPAKLWPRVAWLAMAGS